MCDRLLSINQWHVQPELRSEKSVYCVQYILQYTMQLYRLQVPNRNTGRRKRPHGLLFAFRVIRLLFWRIPSPGSARKEVSTPVLRPVP